MMVTPSVRLVRRLGGGAMGSVWIAEHRGLETQVVVKFMAASVAARGDLVVRFSREAAAAAKVKSPHVVQTLDHGVTDQGLPYITMEFLEGRDLAKHLREYGRLSFREVVSIVSQVAKALTRAHERGIVHRDIKPSNIFLCDVGGGETFVKLVDFGIAKALTRATLSATEYGAVLGTPYYMSPEQMLGEGNVDHRADVWSLGVVAFLALTGSRPFEGASPSELAVAIHLAPLPVPSSRDSSLPRAVNEWFLRACARDPAERFASVRELSDGLALALGVLLETHSSSSPSLVPPKRNDKTERMIALWAPETAPTPLAYTTREAPNGLAAMAPASAVPTPAKRTAPAMMILGAIALVAVGAMIAVTVMRRSDGIDRGSDRGAPRVEATAAAGHASTPTQAVPNDESIEASDTPAAP